MPQRIPSWRVYQLHVAAVYLIPLTVIAVMLSSPWPQCITKVTWELTSPLLQNRSGLPFLFTSFPRVGAGVRRQRQQS